VANLMAPVLVPPELPGTPTPVEEPLVAPRSLLPLPESLDAPPLPEEPLPEELPLELALDELDEVPSNVLSISRLPTTPDMMPGA
jgi:hypothetical protein